MKTKLFTLFSLLALLLVSTAILADGRPTGIRIGRAASGGGDASVEIDVTVTDTWFSYAYPTDNFYTYYGISYNTTTVWIGNILGGWVSSRRRATNFSLSSIGLHSFQGIWVLRRSATS